MAVPIPLARADWRRDVAKEARIFLRNRYFEDNPALTQDQVALIARPGERYGLSIGNGPIRYTYTAPGAFDNDLFAVSEYDLYRVASADLTDTLIGTTGTDISTSVEMAATGTIGETPGHLFICDSGILWCYTEDGYAVGSFTATGAIANNDTITVGTTYYKWTSGSVDTGTPAGTVGNPWLVDLGATDAESLENMFHAINETGTAGTTYSTALTINAFATAYTLTATAIYVRAVDGGAAGNSVALAETGANITVSGATLTDGGDPSLLQIPTPNDVGVISLAHIASYIIVVPAQDEGINGRFFWINPGETTIDPLDFATAERAPDAIYQVIVFGDQFWLLGQSTVETWYMTGDLDAPVIRTQGILFDRGTWQGTGIQVNDSLILADASGRVFRISNGVEEISTPDVAERIREAIKLAAA